MAKGIGLRKDFDAAGLRRLARGSKDSGQARRLLALADIYDGGSRSEAAAVGGVTLQSIRDWVLRFNRRGPEGLIDLKAPGPKPKLSDEQRQALRQIVERGPFPAVDEVVRWRLIDLVQWLSDEFGVSLDETTVGRMLKAMGYRKLTARPRHYAQNEFAVEAFKKTSPRKSPRSAPASRRGRKSKSGSRCYEDGRRVDRSP
jgi:transposase